MAWKKIWPLLLWGEPWSQALESSWRRKLAQFVPAAYLACVFVGAVVLGWLSGTDEVARSWRFLLVLPLKPMAFAVPLLVCFFAVKRLAWKRRIASQPGQPSNPPGPVDRPLHFWRERLPVMCLSALVCPGSLALLSAVAPIELARFRPLHYAAMCGSASLTRVLAKVSDVNTRSAWGHTPLHPAADLGHADVVRVLLEAGADPNARGDRNNSTPLYDAAGKGRAEAARILLQAGADPNARTEYSWAPLYTAAQRGHADVVRVLLAAGADPNARTNRGSTPLKAAQSRNHVETITLLEEAGAT